MEKTSAYNTRVPDFLYKPHYVLICLTQTNITYLLNKTQTPVYRNSSPECAAILFLLKQIESSY